MNLLKALEKETLLVDELTIKSTDKIVMCTESAVRKGMTCLGWSNLLRDAVRPYGFVATKRITYYRDGSTPFYKLIIEKGVKCMKPEHKVKWVPKGAENKMIESPPSVKSPSAKDTGKKKHRR